MDLLLLKYVKSFSDGRIRIRHPALHRTEVAVLAQEKLHAVNGITKVECNPASGSALILYDGKTLSKDRLIAIGKAWAAYLDAVQAGRHADIPEF